jgi:hypothetical protein
MRKSIIGALVGGLIIFIWQTLSYTVLHIHRSAEKYTANQDSIINYLHNHLDQSGNYMLPNYPDNATMDQQNKLMEDMQGKPWAVVLYHNSYHASMQKDMLYAFLIDLLVVWILCWLLLKINAPSFGTIFISSVFIGLIVFLNSPLTSHVWYLTYGIKGDLIDAVASFGLTGLWLGWWLRRK